MTNEQTDLMIPAMMIRFIAYKRTHFGIRIFYIERRTENLTVSINIIIIIVAATRMYRISHAKHIFF